MITIKSEEEIELMRHAGYLVSLTHQYLKKFIKEGITTKELDHLSENMMAFLLAKDMKDFPQLYA